jgi:hypothetical protein
MKDHRDVSSPLNRHPRWLAIGTLSILALLFFLWRLDGDIAAFLYRPGGSVSDLTVTFWPNIHYIQEAWQTYGEIPLWRTLIFCGSPFDADPQSGLWYPANVVFALLPAAIGFNLLFVAHVAWAGVGMWTWSRTTGTSAGGALLAALAYAFTPKVFAHLGFGHVGLVYAAAWVPWALWAAHRIGGGSRSHTAALALSLGLQLIAHPQLAFYTGLVSGAYGLTTAFSSSQRPRFSISGSRLIWLLLGALLALGLSAVQLLPMARLAPLTARSSMGFSETAVSSLPPRHVWGLILADHRGFMDYMLYVGLPVLGLTLLALKHRQAWFWCAFVCLALAYALGTNTPLYRWAFQMLPGLSWLRAPSRIWFLGAAALALMAGWGADRVLQGLDTRSERWLRRIALAAGALALALLLGYSITFGRPPKNLTVFGLITPAVAGLCVAAASGDLPRGTTIVALAGLLLADLWIVDATLIEGRPSTAVFPEGGVGAYLARHGVRQPFRVYSPSYSLPRHVAASLGLETADGVDPLYLETYSAWMEVASGVERTGYTETVPSLETGPDVATANQRATPNSRMLGLLNVRHVAAEYPMSAAGLREVSRFGSTYLYENRDFLPRAFVVGHVEPVEDFEEALSWVESGDDLGRAVAVEDGPALSTGDVEADVTWIRRSPNRLALDVTLEQRGFLLLSQVWYPGWRAKVDGKRVALWKADGVLSGVYLEPGHHAIELAYRPSVTLIGGGVSVMVWLGLGAVVVWRTRRIAQETGENAAPQRQQLRSH